MRSIDAHQHFWRLARGDYGWLTPALKPIYRDFGPAELRPLMGASGVDRTILVQAAPTEAETLFMLEVARASGFVVGVVGWVDMEAPDAPARIAALAADPLLRGIRPMIHDIVDPDWMLRRELEPALRTIAERGLVFDLLVRPVHLRNALTLLERHPELSGVIDHGAKPDIRGWSPGDADFRRWQADMSVLARQTSADCKLSGLATEAAADWRTDHLRPYVDVLLETFGAQRLIWGSDWPVVDLAGGYGKWHAAAEACIAGLPATDRAAIFGLNAARRYGV
ncbi:MAG: amidohydrolase [Alphaproteobacteria bacterium]|nr:amidohydrolase [Alphaproteobacteria bacterium]